MNLSASSRVHFAGLEDDPGGEHDTRSLSSVGDANTTGALGHKGDEDASSVGLYDETTPLYQRLKELDQLTSSFLAAR